MTDQQYTGPERTPDEVIAEILGRWSVTDLREQTDADLRAADEAFYAGKTKTEIVEQGAMGLINWWKIKSGEHVYEVRRFKTFVWCECKAFFFRKRACKHIALTCGVYCSNCFELSAKVGKYCYDCDQKLNHFLKPTPERTWNPTGTL